MKKCLIIAFLFLSGFSLFANTVYSSPTPFQMIGYIGTAANFTAALDYNVLPFDIEGDSVKKNSDNTIVRGLQIGTYSLFCNTTFTLAITHDKLVHKDPDLQSDKPYSADYRLDVFYGSGNTSFKKCAAAANTVNLETSIEINQDNASVAGSGLYEIVNKAFYVSMIGDANALASLQAGTYESTITFDFITGN
ncbi:MAG: hypothetical protein ACQGQO_01580 [Sphaerochaetaceae bacterium]